MDMKSIKIMTLNRYLHPRSSVENLYTKRKDGWRGLISVEDCITAERSRWYDYMKENKRVELKENVIEEGETKEEFSKGIGMKERRLCMKESYKDNL